MLHCLTDVRAILSTSGDYRYLLNELFIDDYCIWIQSVSESVLDSLKEEVAAIEISKADVGLGLEDWEIAAELQMLNIAERKERIDSDDEP